MTFWTLIRRSLRFHARSHVGVVLGATIGSAALIGALVVGDSVRESLREKALQRLDNAYLRWRQQTGYLATAWVAGSVAGIQQEGRIFFAESSAHRSCRFSDSILAVKQRPCKPCASFRRRRGILEVYWSALISPIFPNVVWC